MKHLFCYMVLGCMLLLPAIEASGGDRKFAQGLDLGREDHERPAGQRGLFNRYEEGGVEYGFEDDEIAGKIEEDIEEGNEGKRTLLRKLRRRRRRRRRRRKVTLSPTDLATTRLVEFDATISSNMVLQRGNKPSTLTGFFTTETLPSTISLIVSDEKGRTLYTVEGVISKNKKGWEATLEPCKVGDALTISLVPDIGLGSTITDLVCGDVFLCSGQSNMELKLTESYELEALMQTAKLDDTLRILLMGGDPLDKDGLTGFGPVGDQAWLTPTETMDQGIYADLSATCLSFAYRLITRFGGEKKTPAPIGLIMSARGGSVISHWMPKEAANRCKQERRFLENQEEGAIMNRTLHVSAVNRGYLFNGKILPFTKRPIKGFIWYQGEGNVQYPGFIENHDDKKISEYACQISSLVESIRLYFDIEDLATFVVTLAPGAGTGIETYARMRHVQMTVKRLPNVFVTHAYDLGDPWASSIEEQNCLKRDCCPYPEKVSEQRSFNFKPAKECWSVKEKQCKIELDGSWCTQRVELRGDYRSPAHPRNKMRVGDRIAALVESNLYGKSKIFAEHPRILSITQGNSEKNSLMLEFSQQRRDEIEVNEPIVGNTAFEVCVGTHEQCQCPFWEFSSGKNRYYCAAPGWKQLAKNSKFRPSDIWKPVESVELDRNGRVEIYPRDSELNQEINGVRYAWSENPCCDYNQDFELRTGRYPCPTQNCQVLTKANSLPPDPFFAVIDVNGKVTFPLEFLYERK